MSLLEDSDSMDQIFWDLEQKIEKLFNQDDLAALNDPASSLDNDNRLFLSTPKLSMLIFRINAHNINSAVPVVEDINAPILDGMYPLHLALLTPCTPLIDHLIVKCGANTNVKCSDPNSPFFRMTPLEMALHLMSKLISWTPQLSLLNLISMFNDKKPGLLLQNIHTLVMNSVGVRDLVFHLSHDVKLIELAALLTVASELDNTLSTMYIPTARIPPEHHFGVPMLLRLLVASRISSLIKEEILFKLTGAQDSDDAYQNHKKRMLDLTTVMKLLESADRGELFRAFHLGECPAVEKNDENLKDKDDNKDMTRSNNITKESQDESWVNRYLNAGLCYIDRSLFQPYGIFNSLLPAGYIDDFSDSDGLDILDGSAAETIFRELNGRKLGELSFRDSWKFRDNLGRLLRDKFRESNILKALAMEQNRKQTERIKKIALKPSPPHNLIINRNLHTLLPVYSSTRNSLLLSRKMSWFVFGDDDQECHRKTRCCADRKQNKCIEDWSSFASEEIRVIIENDKASEFKSILEKSEIKNGREDVLLAIAGCELCPYDILGKICHHRAFNCAEVLLSHEVGSMMNLNIQNCYGSYPLHDAAITLSSSLVKLLLHHGASLETGTSDPVPSQIISSLDYAVEKLSCDRNLIYWSPKKSVFKLIITLCLPHMKEARDTIALLAGAATNTNILRHAILNAVMRGQVVAVAALLLVAREKVLGLPFFGNAVSSGSLEFPKAIMNELATLVNQEYALMGREKHSEILKLCLEKKELMIYFLQMLEIFKRAGPDLDSYLDKIESDLVVVPNEKVSNDVTKLLQNARFTLSTKDTDISDITSNLDSSLKPDPVPSDIEMEQQVYKDNSKDIWFKPVSKQLCQCDVKNSSCTTSKVFHRLVGQNFIHGQHRVFSSHAGPYAYHASWTIPPRDISFLTCSPKVFGRVEPQGKSRTTVKESSKLLQGQVSKRVVRSVSVLLAAFKRGVRGV